MVSWVIIPFLFGAILIIGGSICTVIALGALNMKKLTGYEFARFASVVAMLPIHPGFLVGLPVGIWSLVVLSRPEVKAAFDRRRTQGGSSSGDDPAATSAPHKPKADQSRPQTDFASTASPTSAGPKRLRSRLRTAVVLVLLLAVGTMTALMLFDVFPGSPIDPRLVNWKNELRFSPQGPITRKIERDLRLNDLQVAALNEVLRDFHQQYLQLESRYTERQDVSSDSHSRAVRLTIYPFRQDVEQLRVKFKRQVAAILDQRQVGIFHDRFPFEDFFAYGEHPAKVQIEIGYGDGYFDYREDEEGSLRDSPSIRVTDLPPRYQRLLNGSAAASPAVKYLDGHTDRVTAVVANRNHVVSAGHDGRVVIRSLKDQERPTIVGPVGDGLLCLSFSEDEKYVFAGGYEHSVVRRIDLSDGAVEDINVGRKEGQSTHLAGGVSYVVSCDQDSKLVYYDWQNTQLRMFDIAKNTIVGSFVVGHLRAELKPGQSSYKTLQMALSSDRKHLAVASGITHDDRQYRLQLLDTTGSGHFQLLYRGERVETNRTVLPEFRRDEIRMIVPSANRVRHWRRSSGADAWLEERPSTLKLLPKPIGDWAISNYDRKLWLLYGGLVMGVEIKERPRDSHVAMVGGRPTVIAPIPNSDRVAVGLEDGRLTIVQTRRVSLETDH